MQWFLVHLYHLEWQTDCLPDPPCSTSSQLHPHFPPKACGHRAKDKYWLYIRGSVSKIISELVIETSYIFTVRCFGVNTWLAWGERYPTSRSKDTICLVSSFQRQVWQDSPIKQSLVGKKWSDKGLTKGYRNRWVILLSSKFHSSTTFWDTLSTARYCPLGEN